MSSGKGQGTMEKATTGVAVRQPPRAVERAKREHRWNSRPLTTPIAELGLLRKSLLFAELSDVAYYAEEAARPIFEKVGLHASTYFEREGAQAYIVSNQHDTVVICRGTEPNEWNDIKADVNVWTVLAESVGRVHRGFKEEVDTLWPLIESALAETAKTTWFTGHSLGAAMAAICAGRCMLSKIESNPAGLFTFGSPRVGSRRYVNHCRFPEYYRWVNNNDLVTRTPPVWLGYHHAGRLMYLDSNGRPRSLSRARRAKDRWRGLWRGLKSGQLDPLTDHLSSNYIRYLADAVAAEDAGENVLGRGDRLWQRVARKVRRRHAPGLAPKPAHHRAARQDGTS
jgi:triacylglycerol lipase